MDKTKRTKLHKLLGQWTRAEILARLLPLGESEIDYNAIMLEKENEIREYLYGSSDLVKLGLEWKIINKRRGKQSKR